jgi:hypothetical protein
MKKLWIAAVLLAAGAFAASGLFAQEIKFDGYANAGLGLVYSNEKKAEGEEDFFIAANASDAITPGFQFRLNAAYNNEAGNIGAYLRLQAAGGYNNITVPVAYGWFTAFNNILHVKGGLVDDITWSTGGAYLNGDMGEGLGALARITPVTGLNIGLGAYLTHTPASTFENVLLYDNNPIQMFGNGKYYVRDPDKAKYTFNLGYTLSDLLKFVASYRPKSETVATAAGANNPYLSSQLRAAVSLLAVPKLRAILELELDNLQDFKKMKPGDKNAWHTDTDAAGVNEVGANGSINASGKISIFETFQYDMGNLSVGLWAAQWLSQGEKPLAPGATDPEAADLGLYVNPWVSYAFGSIVTRLDLGYGSGARAGFNNNSLNWNRAVTNYTPMYNDDYSVISIRPSVKFNLDARTFIEIGDLLDIDGAPKGTWAADPDSDSRISNVFYVDFKWTF